MSNNLTSSAWNGQKWSGFSHKNSHFWTSGTLDRCLEWAKKVLSHALPCIGVCYGALDTFQVGQSSLGHPRHFGLVLALKIAIFGPLEPWIGAWNGQKWS